MAADRCEPRAPGRRGPAHRETSPRARNAFVKAVKTMFNWGIKQGLVEDNPAAHVSVEPRAPRRPKALTPQQVADLMEAGDQRPPLGDFCRLLLYTGARRGELAGLAWSAYDEEHGTLMLLEHKTVGRRGQPRLLPLSDAAREVLDRQPHTGVAVFSTEDGTPITAGAFTQRLKKLRARPEWADRLRGLSFHRLRHTFVSRLLAGGVAPWQAQRLVGHTSELMTLYYAKADMEQLRSAAGVAAERSVKGEG